MYSLQIAPCFLPKELFIFTIPINKCEKYVYMRFPLDYRETHTYVTVQTDRFLSVWKDAPRFDDPPFTKGTPYATCSHIWHLDRKLLEGHAEDGFSRGITNPVPLAMVQAVSNRQVSLLNGITRTLWLLTHNVEAFPLLCPMPLAEELNSIAGLCLRSVYQQIPCQIMPSPSTGIRTAFSIFFKRIFKRIK